VDDGRIDRIGRASALLAVPALLIAALAMIGGPKRRVETPKRTKALRAAREAAVA
jgi:hypothetical protein